MSTATKTNEQMLYLMACALQGVSAHTSMAICFDLDGLHDNTLAEKDITNCLNVLDEYVSEKKLEYRDADTAFWVLAQKEGKTERDKAEFDRYAQQQKARIKELRDIISEIYSHQDEYRGTAK